MRSPEGSSAKNANRPTDWTSTPTTITGRRPTWSDSAPQTGAITAFTAVVTVTAVTISAETGAPRVTFA